MKPNRCQTTVLQAPSSGNLPSSRTRAHAAKHCHAGRAASGFTLIELMIVMAVIAILAAIAYPSYKEQVARSRRADARAALLENAQLMERIYTVTSKYTTKGDGTSLTIADLPNQQSPKSGTKFYTIQFSAATSPATNPAISTFTLEAVPTGGMSGDSCGTLTLTQTGLKGQGSGKTNADCWDR